MERLPEDPHQYFKPTRGAVMISISKLRPTHRRPKGVAKARNAMRLAYDNKIGRRAAISVRKNSDGTYSILDGNSTYAIAKENGWKKLPAVIEESRTISAQLSEAINP